MDAVMLSSIPCLFLLSLDFIYFLIIAGVLLSHDLHIGKVSR